MSRDDMSRGVVADTARLALRLQHRGDAAFLLELLNDRDFLRYVGDRGVRTIEDAERYIAEGAIASYETNGFGLYLVEERESGVAVGVCGLLQRDFLEHPDLGFAFLPGYRGRGYGREAAEATLALARDVHGLAEVVAIVTPSNEVSIRLLERLGFRSEGPVAHPEGADVYLYRRTLG